MAVGIPPYVSYRTFDNFLQELSIRGLPGRIDRSILASKSGTVQSQLLLAFRYLDLITDLGHPTEKLQGLAKSDGRARKTLLREILKGSYEFIFDSDVDLSAATSNQMEELFQKTGASGETVRRCIAFFLAAARNAGIPCSPYLKPHRGKRTSSKVSDAAPRGTAEESLSRPSNALAAKRVELKSGGSLTLELSLDVFDLSEHDRQFVFGLIDEFNKYPQ